MGVKTARLLLEAAPFFYAVKGVMGFVVCSKFAVSMKIMLFG